MINFEAVQHNQFSFNLQKQNGILMRLISSLMWAKKDFFSDVRMQSANATRGRKFFFRPESSVLV
jgi:hypothetical protein